jgi:hypothetical protein
MSTVGYPHGQFWTDYGRASSLPVDTCDKLKKKNHIREKYGKIGM